MFSTASLQRSTFFSLCNCATIALYIISYEYKKHLIGECGLDQLLKSDYFSICNFQIYHEVNRKKKWPLLLIRSLARAQYTIAETRCIFSEKQTGFSRSRDIYDTTRRAISHAFSKFQNKRFLITVFSCY